LERKNISIAFNFATTFLFVNFANVMDFNSRNFNIFFIDTMANLKIAISVLREIFDYHFIFIAIFSLVLFKVPMLICILLAFIFWLWFIKKGHCYFK